MPWRFTASIGDGVERYRRTQKNIGRIFDAAEDFGAVLLFDEGEALFARRSPEVKDSHDRHANSNT